MDKTFPVDMGKELGGKSFSEVFQSKPKIIEFVSACWTDKCTGLFSEFQQYVNRRLKLPIEKDEHTSRCQKYVIENANVPKYMLKYMSWPPQIPDN